MSEWIVTNMEFEEAYAEMYGYKRLVRCKDCKWWGKPNKVGFAPCYEIIAFKKSRWTKCYPTSWHGNDFCCYGERKDDE